MKLICLNKKNSLLMLTLLTAVLFTGTISDTTPEWCWTKSQVNNPGFIFDQSKGGFNWGFCQSKEDSKRQTITYAGFVVTAETPGSITESEVLFKLCGSKGCFPKFITVSTVGFDRQGVRQEIKDFEGVDVGDLEKLKIKINGHTSWQCREIFIVKDGVETKFECLSKLEPCSVSPSLCQIEAIKDGSNTYNVSIKTGDEKEDANAGPIHIVLYGDKRMSPEKIFSDEMMQNGQFKTKDIQTEDIGAIKGVKLILLGKGKWKPTLVKVRSEATGEEKIFELKNALLQYPGKNTFEVKEKIESNDDSSGNGGGDTEPEQSDDSVDPANFNPNPTTPDGKPDNNKETLNVNNPDGGLIAYNEKSKIINLTCEQKLENTNIIMFGPDYPTQSCEFMNVLARCPHFCAKQNGTVYGIGSHPATSPICLSALVDKAVSLFGGIISISITPGKDQYKVPKDFINPMKTIKVKTFEGGSLKTYSVHKVDNVDLVEKDMRILNAEGALSNAGRIEVRLGGIWGTICTMANDAGSAIKICNDLGYRGGQWESTDANPTLCSSYEGKDTCGVEEQPIFFSTVNCTEGDDTFDKCNKSFADREKCDHSKDAIIKCFNENYQNATRIPNKTVRIAGTEQNKEMQEITGRLEMYSIDKYLPVCNLKFNPAAANLACKTMGYESGVIVSGDDAKKFQNAIDSDLGFSASQVECEENSPNLNACRGIYSAISCTHDMDAVVKCKGENGDPSGRSQYEEKPKNNPPELGKLGLPSVNLTCESKGNDVNLRGDPGSIYQVCCPSGCDKQPGAIWGVGYYSGDSNICKAAQHSGVTDPGEAACFVFTRAHGNGLYKSYNINSVESQPTDGNWMIAFTLARLNSGWTNMGLKWQKDEEVSQTSFVETELELLSQNYSFIETQSDNTVLGFKRISLDDSVSTQSSLNSLKSLLKTKKNSSFLELGMGVKSAMVLPKPIFSFVESNPNHIFSKNDNYVFEGGRLSKVNDFTIFMQFTMLEFSGQNLIFSFKGADGFNIFINPHDELYLGSMTDTKFQHFLGIVVPLKTKVSMFVVYKAGFLSYSCVINNGPNSARSKIAAMFDIPVEGKVGIGRLASVNDKQFTGKINFVEIYPQALTVDSIPQLLIEIKGRKNNNKLVKQYTIDARECVSPCMGSTPETGNPPPEAILNAALSAEISPAEGLIKFGEDQKDEANQSTQPTPKPEPNPNNTNNESPEKELSANSPAPGGVVSSENFTDPPFPASTKLTTTSLTGTNNLEPLACDEDTTLEDHKFKGLVVPKNFFRVTCPKMTAETYYPIFGFAIYRANSSICRAAIHFGKLKPGEKKDVVIRVEGKQQAYNGGMGQFNIQSEDVLETENKLSFTIEEATKLKKINCEDDLRSTQFLNSAISEVFVVECPKDCADITKQIFGGNTTDEKCAQATDNSASNCVYSEDSPICKAAVHCGVLNNMGGFIQLKIDGEQPKFIAQKSFGIESKEKPSQVRSYSFVGERSAIYANFKENFQGSILDNWTIIDTYHVKNKEKNSWSFYENNQSFFNSDGQKENIRAVKHTGIISTDFPFTSASIIKKRDTEFANGLIKFNVMLYEVDPIYVYLRFVDPENHIGLIINNRNNMNNLTLFAKVQGSLKVLDNKFMPWELKKWYRFRVYLHSDTIKVDIQEDKVRTHKAVFNNKFNNITRGTIAFGTNGNDNFFLTGISIEPFSFAAAEKDYESKKVSWNFIINKSTDKNKVKNWCKKTFKHSTDDFLRCTIPQFYCRYRCQEPLPEQVYGIKFYNCVKECVAAMKAIFSPGKEIKPSLEKTYKENDLVDFLPTGEDKFIPAVIMKVENKSGDQFATVEYQDDIGTKHTDEVLFSSDKLDKCGAKLRKRTDCSLNK